MYKKFKPHKGCLDVANRRCHCIKDYIYELKETVKILKKKLNT